MTKTLFVWEEEAEKAIKSLVKVAKAAIKDMTNPEKNGCLGCFNCQVTSHDDDCPVTKLRTAVKEVSRIKKWR